jgi:uncharacterized protein (TIGR02145 family)
MNYFSKPLLLLTALSLSVSMVSQSKDTLANGVFKDQRDGQQYKYITVENKMWMADNLNFNAEGSIPNGDYGRLYVFPIAMQACPEGWHLPSYAEWTQLLSSIAAKHNLKSTEGDWTGIAPYLKSNEGWADGSSNSNEYRFDALPGGKALIKGETLTSIEKGNQGYWWSSTYHFPQNLIGLNMTKSSNDLYTNPHPETGVALSVRCVK